MALTKAISWGPPPCSSIRKGVPRHGAVNRTRDLAVCGRTLNPPSHSGRSVGRSVGQGAQAHVFGVIGGVSSVRVPKTEWEAEPYAREADTGTGERGAPAPRCVPAGEASSPQSERSPPPPFPPRARVHARVAGPVTEPPPPPFPLPGRETKRFNTAVGRCTAARGGRQKGSCLPSASRSPTTGASTSRRRAPAGSVRGWERRAGGRGFQAPEDDP